MKHNQVCKSVCSYTLRISLIHQSNESQKKWSCSAMCVPSGSLLSSSPSRTTSPFRVHIIVSQELAVPYIIWMCNSITCHHAKNCLQRAAQEEMDAHHHLCFASSASTVFESRGLAGEISTMKIQQQWESKEEKKELDNNSTPMPLLHLSHCLTEGQECPSPLGHKKRSGSFSRAEGCGKLQEGKSAPPGWDGCSPAQWLSQTLHPVCWRGKSPVALGPGPGSSRSCIMSPHFSFPPCDTVAILSSGHPPVRSPFLTSPFAPGLRYQSPVPQVLPSPQQLLLHV